MIWMIIAIIEYLFIAIVYIYRNKETDTKLGLITNIFLSLFWPVCFVFENFLNK